jgi:pre-rRNA-processing protein TSR1
LLAQELVAKGDLLRPDPMRVILKRKILTGYPFKIHKRKCVARFMFFNNADIHYFAPIELWTRNKLRVTRCSA